MSVVPPRSVQWGILALLGVAAVLTQPPEPAAASSPLIGSVEVFSVPAPPVVSFGSGIYQPTPREPLEPACEDASDGPVPLLRAGCPEGPPGVGPCSVEGLGCTYTASGECRARFECVYGLWSPVGDACPEGEPWPDNPLRGDGECDPQLPVADTPCEGEGLVCGYVPCPLGEAPSVEAECRCGRWYVQRIDGCAVD